MSKALLLLVIVLQLFLGLGNGSECPCPWGFTKTGSKCYKVETSKQNWESAHETCRQQNSHLVVVKDAATNADLYKAVDDVKSSCSQNRISSPAFWTAGKKNCAKEFVWVLTHDSKWPMQYTNWRQGEPNNASGMEDCVQFWAYSSSNIGWNDASCNLGYCFVCEVDL